MDANESKMFAELMEKTGAVLKQNESLTQKVELLLSRSPGQVADPTLIAEPAPEALKLEPGIYVLTKDIANPAGDRRVTTAFEKIPVWPKGARLTVKKLTVSGKSKRAFSIEPHDPIIENRNNRLIHVEKGSVYNNTVGFGELVAALKREPESVETVIEEVGFQSPLEALKALNESGKVTYDDLRHLRDGPPKSAANPTAEAPF